MSLGARVFLLLVPLLTALDPAAAQAESRDFAGLVDIGGGRKALKVSTRDGRDWLVLNRTNQ
jgi:hypothetical protein